jgi:hypothetical protein
MFDGPQIVLTLLGVESSRVNDALFKCYGFIINDIAFNFECEGRSVSFKNTWTISYINLKISMIRLHIKFQILHKKGALNVKCEI